MPKDDYWRLGGVVLDGHEGPESVHNFGTGYGIEVWLSARSDSPAGAWPDSVERYRNLRQFMNYAGSFALHELASGRVAFTETHSASVGEMPNNSLLVALRPPAGSEIGRGMWALVSSVEDLTTLPDSLCRLTFELTFVAPLAQYQDRQAAVSALATEGI